MEILDPYGFVVRKSDNDLQEDRDLVHESCGTILTRIEHGDNFGTYVPLMNDHTCPDAEIRFEVDGETVTGGQPGETWHAVYIVPAHLAESITTEAEAEQHDTEPGFERIAKEG